MARPQFTMEQRNFLCFEYHKRKGTQNFHPQLLADFQRKFPGARIPGKNIIIKIWKKQMTKGTVNNCNSKTSPGDSHSGRPRTVRTPAISANVKAVMDRDAVKVIIDEWLRFTRILFFLNEYLSIANIAKTYHMKRS